MRNFFLQSWGKFILAYALWLFVFREFLLKQAWVNLDTLTAYAVKKFFLNNLLNGTIPLWDPFVYLGTPFYALAVLAILNPLTVVMALAVKMGVSYYDAFLMNLIGTYFLGCLGFYFFAKLFLRSDRWGFLCFLLILFSGVGINIFTQYSILQIFYPFGWLMFFGMRFASSPKTKDFVGWVTSLMFLLNSYLPFHSLTFGLVFVFFSLVFFPRRFLLIVKESFRFFIKHWGIVLFCLFSLGVCLAPLLLLKSANATGEFVTPARHCLNRDIEACYQAILRSASGMTYEETVKFGTLETKAPLLAPLAHLDKINQGTDCVAYLPILAWLLLSLGWVVKVDRRWLVLFSTVVCIFFVALGAATPVGKWFYDLLPYFKYFRNAFFYSALLLPMGILLACATGKNVIEQINFSSGFVKGFVLSVPVMLCAALIWQGYVLQTTVFTVLMSGLLCFFLFNGRHQRWPFLFAVAVIGLALIEPVTVGRSYSLNATKEICPLPSQHLTPQFSFLRPLVTPSTFCRWEKTMEPSKDLWADLVMQDTSGNLGFPGLMGKGVFFVSKYMNPLTWARYTSNKFVLYDRVRPYQESYTALEEMERTFSGFENYAYVDEPDAALQKLFPADNERKLPKAFRVVKNSDSFRVKSFNVNTVVLETNLPVAKFLVYTDTFHSPWKLFRNGIPEKLYRAQGAFKGFVIPVGAHTFRLQYAPWGGEMIYGWIMLYLTLFAVWSAWFVIKPEKI